MWITSRSHPQESNLLASTSSFSLPMSWNTEIGLQPLVNSIRGKGREQIRNPFSKWYPDHPLAWTYTPREEQSFYFAWAVVWCSLLQQYRLLSNIPLEGYSGEEKNHYFWRGSFDKHLLLWSFVVESITQDLFKILVKEGIFWMVIFHKVPLALNAVLVPLT